MEKMNSQFEELTAKHRDAEARASALQKTLDRKNEELKFFR